ncbi:MAG: phosphoribosylglycinamide formyltransferase [Christensenellales bacterium]|jgi:phosphoribosylglycinamide formyltransferase-1
MRNIAVLASGGGSNLQALIDAIEAGEIAAKISLVVAGKPGIFALERARAHGIESVCICRGDYEDVCAHDRALRQVLRDCGADLVVLAGYLSILGKDLVQEYRNRILNIHPSLIPAFCGSGYYGQRVHQAVLDYGARVSGATVHLVDEGTDTGPIILQQCVEVLQTDNAQSLAARVLEAEHRLLPQAVKLFVEGRVSVEGRKVTILEEEA